MNPWEQIAKLRAAGGPAVVITIAAVRGSVPGQAGAKAVFTADGGLAGNLGGGRVEEKARLTAAALLGGGPPCLLETWNLQRDVGMTCGGEMTFLFERISGNPAWHIAIFGAGHVAQALVPVLATLDCTIDVIDPRPEWLGKIPPAPNVRTHGLESFDAGVVHVTPATHVLAVTQGHSTDRPVLRECLRRFPELPFVGVIGSAAKRAVLLRELREDGIPAASLERITCPLGLPIGGNAPAEIAISITAQLLAVRG